MPGPKINNINDMMDFILSVSKMKDEYKISRLEVNNLCNTFQTPNACERIINFVGISK